MDFRDGFYAKPARDWDMGSHGRVINRLQYCLGSTALVGACGSIYFIHISSTIHTLSRVVAMLLRCACSNAREIALLMRNGPEDKAGCPCFRLAEVRLVVRACERHSSQVDHMTVPLESVSELGIRRTWRKII
jgi:hypothetical protein